MTKAAEPASQDAADESISVAQAAFGNDDLGRLQNILLGDHARQTVDRIDTLEQAVLGVIDDLRTELRDSVSALEGRITAEADTRTSAVSNLTSRIDDETATRKTSIKDLNKDLTKDLRTTESDLNQAIESAASSLTGHIEDLRSTAKDLAAVDADLGDAKVDRIALANLLSAAVAGLEESPA